jgi:hypothetical protein
MKLNKKWQMCIVYIFGLITGLLIFNIYPMYLTFKQCEIEQTYIQEMHKVSARRPGYDYCLLHSLYNNGNYIYAY